MGSLLFRLAMFLLRLTAFGTILWCSGAFWYDFPWSPARVPLAILYGLGMAVVLLAWARGVLIVLAGFALVLLAWLQIRPTNDLPWQPDVARTASAEIAGDRITLHNVRHCDYRSEFDYTTHWNTRTVRLGQITGMDLAMTYWGSEMIAHTIISFLVEGEPPITISIEARKQAGQAYSSIAGFYRQYGLIYIVSDERDLLRLRTNYRTGETVYLYHLKVKPEAAQEIFLDYLRSINSLHTRPEFYNAVTSNCTTNIRTHTRVTMRKKPAWDWRILLNGYLDDLLYEHHALAEEGSFEEIKRRVEINEAAKRIGDAPDFSRQIRKAIGR